MKTSLIIRRGIAAAAFGCALACAAPAHAQELNCTVEVNSSQVSGTNKSMFETLQSAINDYMNTTVFTNAQFAANEKIECRLFFTICTELPYKCNAVLGCSKAVLSPFAK